MAVSPQWRFVLGNSVDLSNVGEVTNIQSPNLQLVFNRPGSFSFTLPLSHDLAPYIWPITSCIKAFRQGTDGAWSLIWSGFVWTIDEDISGNKMSVTCQGWLQLLEKRFLRRTKDYTANNPATGAPWIDYEIIYDLLADANAAVMTWDTPSNYPAGYPAPAIWSDPQAVATKYPTPIIAGASSVGADTWATHGRSYKIDKGASILGEFQKLTDLENGLDLLVNPATRRLDSWAKKMTDRPNAIFGYNWGPSNLSQFGRQIDPSTLVNYMAGSGQDTTILPRFADTQSNPDPTQNPPKLGENSMKTYGLIEESVALSDAKTTEAVAAYVGSEVLLRSSPRIIYSLTPFPFTTDLGPGRIPEPFVDYTVGDKVYLTAKTPRMQIQNQGVRVFGITVTPDANGNEILGQLQVSP